ncbi:uncharacterized protein LOC108917372 isoform X2 [Anoplophora glabripennis]|uniref:uncharacterized protein LOC108917372 isoform X2 n=1 Tax=Anoplophora glabripennis TaxID=217634 RepID=UPI000873A82F|nr:uncharacterized protein LOC108917372 isoform X2 [Anoplophora glabripennis]
MLENVITTKSTMQADDLEEALGKETVAFSSSDMTFNEKDVSSPEMKEEPAVDDANFENTTKFEGINLEDDIEKVEVTSHESSEENEDECIISDTPKSEINQPVFSGIPTQSTSESIKSWLQRITDMQNEIQKKCTTSSGNLNHIQSIANNSMATTVVNSSSVNSSRVVKYQDLPYMGEMTLDNSKPRRGRKPKKADICHLIYKNYGTIFPGTPNPGSYLEKDNGILKKSVVLETKEDSINRSDVQNRIISSLLEKRLTQEYKRTKESSTTVTTTGAQSKVADDQNEPLNLCIRDLNHLKIRLLKKTDNTYTSEIKSEPQSDDDVEFVHETPSPSVSAKNESRFLSVTPDSLSTPSPDPLKTPDGATAPGGYVYWPNAGVFIHPVALQQQLLMYQRMANNNSYILPSNHSPKPPPEASPGGKGDSSAAEFRKLVPKLIKPKNISNRESTEETDLQQLPALELKKRNAPASSEKTPTKRKRSAIFIPPIPAENTANPATEVSICKFKFTGGAKPSLQEKKMLSVDSGGNFRYYSGTGDKSMRGYEFFPRETLQQQVNNTQGSSTGAFLQASGEKIYPLPPVDFPGGKSSSEFLLSPEIQVPTFGAAQNTTQDLNSQRMKKRKSRKSLQREKLEQTFKEKGFLIQTQQTESAEGATYCKFRQLRKFTRYLFRSWKDYLPGNLAEGEQPRGGTSDSAELNINDLSHDNTDNLSVHSNELSANNVH